MAERLLDTDQAAEYLGTTPRHIKGLRQQRKIDVIKIGRLVRFDKKDLDAFIERNREKRIT